MGQPPSPGSHWAIGADGARTLAGLSGTETDEYFSLLHAESELSCQEARDRFRELQRRHRQAAAPGGHEA